MNNTIAKFERYVSTASEFLPSVPNSNGFVLLNLKFPNLMEKLQNYLDKRELSCSTHKSSVKVEVNLLEEFVTDIIDKKKLFNEIEMESINVLFLEGDEEVNYSTLGKVQNLYKLYKLIKAKDLIYIIKNKRLITYFQPIVDVKNKSIYAYECLSRGLKKDNTIMGSHLLFMTASRNDLLHYLDREAREQSLTNALNKNINKKIFINFAPGAIYNPETSLEDTFQLTKELGYKPENIVFEIIESEDIIDPKHLSKFLERYRKKGFEIALDDIGSGYSSLNLLSDIKPDYIKVDMEIVRNINQDRFKQSIFDALSYIAKKNNIKLLAEGVETKEELNYCVKAGASLIQGYYFSHPTKEPLIDLDLNKFVY